MTYEWEQRLFNNHIILVLLGIGPDFWSADSGTDRYLKQIGTGKQF